VKLCNRIKRFNWVALSSYEDTVIMSHPLQRETFFFRHLSVRLSVTKVCTHNPYILNENFTKRWLLNNMENIIMLGRFDRIIIKELLTLFI
jgi:hypothetical protein